MDFSAVKKINIPEGEVKQISVNGVVIWKGTVNISVSTDSHVAIVGAGEYDNGSTFTVSVIADTNYYLQNNVADNSGITITYSNPITLNGSTAYRAITYTGTATDNLTISVDAYKYYTFTYGDGSTHTEGTLTFSNGATKTISGNNQSGDVYYTGSITANITYYSRLTYSGTQGYNADDRVITGYSGASSYTSLGSLWLGSGTGYKTVSYSGTISDTNKTFSVSATDSRAGNIVTNGLSVTITNSSTSKSYTSSSNFQIYTSYNGSSTSLSVNNPSDAYNYSGTGSITLGDSSNSPTTHTVSRSVKSYTLSYSGGSNVSSVSVSRTSSPYAGASTGGLSSGSTIYYGDTLSVSATPNSYYVIDSSSYSSSYTVYGNISFTVTASFDNNPNITHSAFVYGGFNNKVAFTNNSPYSITITQIVTDADVKNKTFTMASGKTSGYQNVSSSATVVRNVTWYYTDLGSGESRIKYF